MNPEAKETAAIAVFVKTPGLSAVKTRLAASVGREVAEEFHILAVQATQAVIQKAVSLSKAPITAYWAIAEREALNHASWNSFKNIFQGCGPLGERLANVYTELLTKHGIVLLIGADSPQLSPKTLVRASLSKKFVMGRAEDGGFYLFGGRTPISKEIWLKVSYSAASTADELASGIESLGHLEELASLRDVDTIEDLRALAKCKSTEALLPEQQKLLSWIKQL